jgi:NADPH-dependent ferric siderophore reductase
MSPQFVKPYVMSNKNDRNDAKGIAEAVTRALSQIFPTAEKPYRRTYSVRHYPANA